MARPIQKILLIRLSSIGDIVLCSPVVRSLRTCFPNAEIHFLTKKAFASLLQHDPAIDKLHLFAGDLSATIRDLRKENFDQVLDLHRSIRSRRIKLALRIPTASYQKDRWSILLYTKYRIGKLPGNHTVDRYAAALDKIGCQLDSKGLDFFLPDEARQLAKQNIAQHFSDAPVAVVLGGNFQTKRWPKEYFLELLNELKKPVLLLGGKAEIDDAKWIDERLEVQSLNAVAQYDLLLSSAMLERAEFVITHDTGLMHIATALGQTIFSIWGSTVPEIGFSPYKAKKSIIIENKELSCRPCSKLGHAKCPKGHFKCMMDIKPTQVLEAIRTNT